MNRAEIERELLAWMRDEPEREDEARFERLAGALFAWQLAHCAPYRRFCEGRGVSGRDAAGGAGGALGWRDLPPVPTGAFKELALRSFPASATRKTFRTSGTSTERRGELHLDTLELYEASLVPSFEAGVLPDVDGALPILVLAPSAEEAPDSSLSHMFAVMLARRGAAGSGFFVESGTLQADALIQRLTRLAAAGDGPLLLCGTAFAFVHLVEALDAAGRKLSLPAGARLMETGGFKGRGRERGKDELYRELGDALGVPPERIVNQYGMTELGSQFYDTVLAEPGEPGPRRKRIPPWVRVRLLDPLAGTEVAPGELGLVTVVDLANTGSVLALQTADLGRAVGAGFEVLGREPGAEARGCSIAADAMLGAGRSR